MRIFAAHKRTLTVLGVGWLLALFVALVLPEETPMQPVASLHSSSTACEEVECGELGEPLPSPSPEIARPAPKPRKVAAARRKPKGPESRVILMRPPYDMHRRRVALTCGYHDSCKRYPGRRPQYPAGFGLDWNDNNGTWPETKAVYFTASAYAPRARTRIATVSFLYYKPGRVFGYPCSTLVAVVRSYPRNQELFRVMYQHVAPTNRLRPFPVYGVPTGANPNAKPNVVMRIGTMINDPCAYFTRTEEGRPLFHAHVEPQRHNTRVRFRINRTKNSRGWRVIPDVNGCRNACSGPAYPGPRMGGPYWKLWTTSWSWRVDSRGVLR